jgi:hypothetical protein
MRSLRTPRILSDSLRRRLNMYALAASAAGVSVLALAPRVEGEVIYTPAHKWLPINRFFSLDLNHDGVTDFRFILASHSWSLGFSRGMSVRRGASTQSQNNLYTSNGGNHFWPLALPEGKMIGPKSPGFKGRSPGGEMFFSGSSIVSGHQSSGPWLNIKGQAYLGVRFAIKGEVHYGWVRLGNISRNKPAKVLLSGYAYQTIPNHAITAGYEGTGDRSARGEAPGSLGHLAQGRKDAIR